MNAITRQKLTRRKQKIERRLDPERRWAPQDEPMLAASNIHYELCGRVQGISAGGIGAIHLLARRVGLVDEINARLKLLKVHLPYHESDHVLNMAYNILAGGRSKEDIEHLRNDANYLDALGAQRIPDPTTEGDFCDRFSGPDVDALMKAVNVCRLRVWAQQPDEFFEEAVIDVDGVLATTEGECKEGADFNYKGEWGYHPLIVSLANTQEWLYLDNRSGNRPSHEGAARRLDEAGKLCRLGGFRRVLFRGDTDFSQTGHLDRWDKKGYRFIFGMAAMTNLVEKADSLCPAAWKPLDRPPKYVVKTTGRRKRERVRERIVEERGYENIKLMRESVGEFDYRPGKCKKTYRVVVVRKDLEVTCGQRELFADVRYLFYITNDRETDAAGIVRSANGRCNQENLNEQLRNGVHALRMPEGDLVSNWAYMVMASLGWTLKAWFALLLPVKGRWKERHEREKDLLLRMKFRKFLRSIMLVPCQIVRTARRIVYRLLSWTPWQGVFLRVVEGLRRPLRC